MLSDILNNEDATHSPCLVCPHRDMDKNKCSVLCLRLAAYNSGESWEEKPLPYIREGNKMKEQKERKEDRENRIEVEDQGPPKNENSPLERGGREADGVCESSDNQQSKACVICHEPDKKILNKRSQTCGACYQAWNTGKITHPTLGKFTPSLTKSKITKTKKTKSPRAVIPAKAGIQADEDKITKTIPKIVIDLEKYPRIKRELDHMAERYFVTSEHVIIDMLGWALAFRKGAKAQK